MTKKSDLGGGWLAKNLDDVDREVARCASICQVRLLDPGIIARVLAKDDSVCGTKNPKAFEKLRNALSMHYHIRTQAVDVIGETATAEVIEEIVANIRKRIGNQLGGNPSK